MPKPTAKKASAPPTLPDDPLAEIRARLGAGGTIKQKKKQAVEYATVAFEDEDETIEVHVPTLEASDRRIFHSIAEIRAALSGGSSASTTPATNHWDSQARTAPFHFTDQKVGAVVKGTVTMKARSLSPSANQGIRTAMVWMEVAGTIAIGGAAMVPFSWRSESNIVELEEEVSEEQYLQQKIDEAVDLAIAGARDRVKAAGSLASEAARQTGRVREKFTRPPKSRRQPAKQAAGRKSTGRQRVTNKPKARNSRRR